MAEKHTFKPLLCLRTDGGGEYNSNAFKTFYSQHGILHQISTPYTPQQNGLAERKNRTLLTMTRSMLKTTNLPSCFWEQALGTSCYLQNRTYHRSLGLITPYQKWYGTIPNLTDLKVFGSKAYSFVPAEKRNKLNT